MQLILYFFILCCSMRFSIAFTGVGDLSYTDVFGTNSIGSPTYLSKFVGSCDVVQLENITAQIAGSSHSYYAEIGKIEETTYSNDDCSGSGFTKYKEVTSSVYPTGVYTKSLLFASPTTADMVIDRLIEGFTDIKCLIKYRNPCNDVKLMPIAYFCATNQIYHDFNGVIYSTTSDITQLCRAGPTDNSCVLMPMTNISNHYCFDDNKTGASLIMLTYQTKSLKSIFISPGPAIKPSMVDIFGEDKEKPLHYSLTMTYIIMIMSSFSLVLNIATRIFFEKSNKIKNQ